MTTRVLHIHSGNLYGGVETLLVTLAHYRRLCPAMEPEFALCFDGRLASELRQAGVPVHRLGEVRARRPLRLIRERRHLRELLGHQHFDAVVCHMPWAQAIFGPAVRDAAKPLVFWMHGASAGRYWLERWAQLTPPDLTLCGSKFAASSLRNLYPNSAHEVIHLPVARRGTPIKTSQRGALREELDTPAHALVIIQASRLEPLKGHRVHLEALGLLSDMPGWNCWFVGGAQTTSEQRYIIELREMASVLGISERVRFLGQRSDVERLLDAADIYCQPNVGPDAFGIAFVEAMLSGLPVVTSAIGAATEIVDRSSGITIAPGDVGALADALRELIQDTKRRERLSAAAQKRAVELCDPGRQLNRLCKIVTDAADSRINKGTAPAKPVVTLR